MDDIIFNYIHWEDPVWCKAFRHVSGISQHIFSERTGINTCAISNYEKGSKLPKYLSISIPTAYCSLCYDYYNSMRPFENNRAIVRSIIPSMRMILYFLAHYEDRLENYAESERLDILANGLPSYITKDYINELYSLLLVYSKQLVALNEKPKERET